MSTSCAASILPQSLILLCALTAHAHSANLLANGGFERTRELQGAPSGDIGFGVWSLGDRRLVPEGWQLNPAYPGTVEVVSEGAPEGGSFLRLHADGQRGPAHVFQPCPGIKPGGAYQVRARVRGGPVNLGAYEYFDEGRIGTPTVLAVPAGDEWREVSAFYSPHGEGLRSLTFAIMLADRLSVDIDDIRIEEAQEMAIPEGLEPVVLETDHLRVTITSDGKLDEFTCKATGVNYVQPGPKPAVFALRTGSSEIPVHYIRRQGSVIDVQFAAPGCRASLKYERSPDYFTLALRSVSPADAEWVQLCRFPLSITQTVGTLVNAAWDDSFAACALACNDRTDAFGASASRGDLVARCHGQFGMVGARVAVVGIPLDPPGATDRLLDAIEEVELGEGLPHPTMNGVWIKRAPERFASYLMAYGITEANIDEVVEFAKGGFGCVEMLNWWHSTPAYEPNLSLFPSGIAGMRSCADKIHAAGMEVGLHVMQGMVGWGGVGMLDPYVSPVADPRLLRSRETSLSASISADATEIVAGEDLAGWPERGDLFVDGELVRYTGREGSRFVQCQRGLHRTLARDHAAGTPVGLMKNCFDIWDHVIYAPQVNSTMVDEICGNIARVFNAVGADMTYFDGGEEIAVQPPQWHNQGKVALGVFDRLDEAVILEGNALYTNLSWHVITRGSPHYDPIYYGRRDYTLRNKGQNPAHWARNLLTGDVGWFQAHTHSRATYAVTPDEVQLLCLKAVGGRAPISFIVGSDNLWANKRMPEMLEIIRTCDRLKREESLSREVLAELGRPWAEHSLSRSPDGRWSLHPLQMDWPRLLTAGETDSLTFDNSHPPQRPWLQLRARSRPAEFGAEGNIALTDGAGLKPDGTASPELTHQVRPSAETAPDGSATFAFSAKNAGEERSGWCRVSQPLEPVRDLSRHRCLGLWVHGEGKGGVLNVQLAHRHGFRDHYIDLDYQGWRYHVLSTGESARFYDYSWPHKWVDLMYQPFNYAAVEGMNLIYTALPPETEVTCFISRVEALREHDLRVERPSLAVAGRQITFPVSLMPDEYLEMDWEGKCRHFDPNGGLLADVTPEGDISLAQGAGNVRLACATGEPLSPRVEVTVATRGAAFAEGIQPLEGTGPVDAGLHLEGKPGRFRLVDGLYERVSRRPPQAIGALDGAANVWTVESEAAEPRPAAMVIDYTRAETSALPDETTATEISAFGDLSAYDLSDRNQYAQYVEGGGRQLSDEGPVRAGVSQSLAACDGGPVDGAPCVQFAATNEGDPAGWCGKGMRFEPALDLSKAQLLSMWVHGDGAGELLKIQFRDAEGNWRDWNVPIRFTGWQRQVYRTDRAPGFDWAQVSYVILYYNDIPAQRSVAVKLSHLLAADQTRPAASLANPSISLNGERIALGSELAPGCALTVDATGRISVWRPGMKRSEPAGQAPAGPMLKPGTNRIEFTCESAPAGEIAGLSVTVVGM